jgi:hypothetical protein
MREQRGGAVLTEPDLGALALPSKCPGRAAQHHKQQEANAQGPGGRTPPARHRGTGRALARPRGRSDPQLAMTTPANPQLANVLAGGQAERGQLRSSLPAHRWTAAGFKIAHQAPSSAPATP